jgi:hypothetical protein
MPVYKLGVNYDGENKVMGIGILRLGNRARYRPELYPNSTGNIKDKLRKCYM